MSGSKRWSRVSGEAQGFVINRLKTELIDLKKDHAAGAAHMGTQALEIARGREEAVELAIETLYLARVEVPGTVAEAAVTEIVGEAEVLDAAEVVDEIRALPSSVPAHGVHTPVANAIPALPHAGHPARASFGVAPGLIAHVPFGAATALAAPGEGAQAVPTRDTRILDETGVCLLKVGEMARHKPTARMDVVIRIESKFAYFARGGIYKLTELERV